MIPAIPGSEEHTVSVTPGQRVTTDLLTSQPWCEPGTTKDLESGPWCNPGPFDPDSYYTYLVVDPSFPGVEETRLIWYMKVNVKGADTMKSGTEAMDWVPPFAFQFDSSKDLIKSDYDFNHPAMFLMYKQEKELESSEYTTQTGCTEDIITKRNVRLLPIFIFSLC